MSVVRDLLRAWMAECTTFSVLVSSADDHSSRMSTGASFKMQRAMATRCFSPPLSLRPRSPTTVLNCSGSDIIVS